MLGLTCTDNSADDFRSKMVEADVLAHLVVLLQNSDLLDSSMETIINLAKFGMLLSYFEMLKG
jgi:hypothetical protein